MIPFLCVLLLIWSAADTARTLRNIRDQRRATDFANAVARVRA